MSEHLSSNSQINVTGIRPNKLRYAKKCKAEIVPTSITPLQDTQVLVQTLFSGISRGTESLVFHGRVPLSEHERMQCPHQDGSFEFPITYGYASVGKVIAKGPSVTKSSIGQTVFVLHPHQDFFVVDESWINPLPDGAKPELGVLSANLETALNATWDADIKEAMRVAVIGAGVVGLLTACVCAQETGTRPLVIDINPAKRTLADKLGLDFATPDDLAKSVDQEFERIFNTSASEKGLQTAIDHAAFEAKIIEMSWYGAKRVTLQLGGAFHSRRLQLISSQVGSVAASRRKTVTHSDRMQQAMSYLSDTRLECLLHPHISFNELPGHLNDIFGQTSDALCPLVIYMNP